MKKNKVILFILILFIIIGLHNCCSAFETDTEYVVDFSSIGGDLKVSFSSDNFPSSQELNGKTISDFNGVLIGYYNNYYVLYLILTGSNVYLDSSDGSTLYFVENLNGSDINYARRYSFSTNKTTAYLTTADFADNYGSMWIDTNYSFNCSQSIYSNNTFTTIYENNNYINNSSDIFDNGSNGDNGGDSGGDTEEDGFFADFWQNLLHIFLPDEEDFNELKDNFQEKILNKFGISAWSFNDTDIDYTNEEIPNGLLYYHSNPKLDFNILGSTFTFDTTKILNFLNTPFNFGHVTIGFGDDSDHGGDVDLPTGGLCLNDILNFVININIFITNIVLYNKFLNKGGE